MAPSEVKNRLLHLVIDETDDRLLRLVLDLLERRPAPTEAPQDAADEAMTPELAALLTQRAASDGAGVPWQESLRGIMQRAGDDPATIALVLNERPLSRTA